MPRAAGRNMLLTSSKAAAWSLAIWHMHLLLYTSDVSLLQLYTAHFISLSVCILLLCKARPRPSSTWVWKFSVVLLLHLLAPGSRMFSVVLLLHLLASV